LAFLILLLVLLLLALLLPALLSLLAIALLLLPLLFEPLLPFLILLDLLLSLLLVTLRLITLSLRRLRSWLGVPTRLPLLLTLFLLGLVLLTSFFTPTTPALCTGVAGNRQQTHR
jgi:hypothetical protein